MNRIGFTLLFLGTLLFLNTSCQNFFWSHRCCDEQDTILPVTNYGFLYNWYASLGDGGTGTIYTTNIANEGWRLPTYADYLALQSHIGGEATGGLKLKEAGTTYWVTDNGTNDYNFNGRGAPQRNTNGVYTFPKGYAWYWIDNGGDTFNRIADLDDAGTFILYQATLRDVGNYIRLIKESLTPAELALPDGAYANDYIGNNGVLYKTVKIGTQIWMAHNLEETKYRDGTDIVFVDNTVSGTNIWKDLFTGAYCIYETP